jgi:hypothetical protein
MVGVCAVYAEKIVGRRAKKKQKNKELMLRSRRYQIRIFAPSVIERRRKGQHSESEKIV